MFAMFSRPPAFYTDSYFPVVFIPGVSAEIECLSLSLVLLFSVF